LFPSRSPYPSTADSTTSAQAGEHLAR